MRPKRLCSSPGCRVVVTFGKCPRHAAVAHARELERQKQVDAGRAPETRGRYSSPRWREERRVYLSERKLCPCGKRSGYVDHIKPWRSFPTDQQDAAFWDKSNWQPLCHSCHSRKTAKHDGGFGNPRRA